MQRLTWLVGVVAIVVLSVGCGGGNSNYRIPTGDNVQPFAPPEEEDLTGEPAADEPDTGWDDTGDDGDDGDDGDADKTKAGDGAGASKTAPPEAPSAKAPAKAPAGKAPAKAPAAKAPAKTPVKPK